MSVRLRPVAITGKGATPRTNESTAPDPALQFDNARCLETTSPYKRSVF
ncbi:hypothetical protein MARSALSMR5_04167 (plasmid) [Marinobacter salarius]|uniref:Uncharacterized protein n=1 Tax=Marinobacter salarius TaxID=1420917 RepID=A0A1W6KFK1_9GAMM|nr:hypothetical protein MARSALSMR5_04167 [Marinobacter salarius]